MLFDCINIMLKFNTMCMGIYFNYIIINEDYFFFSLLNQPYNKAKCIIYLPIIKNVLLYIGIGSYIIKYFLKFLVCFSLLYFNPIQS